MKMANTWSLVAVVGMVVLGAGSVGCGGSSPPAAAAPSSSSTTASAGAASSQKDSDDDGVFDDVDLCPNQKEDGKGDKPKDGCPEKT
jgi:hypothetical protein